MSATIILITNIALLIISLAGLTMLVTKLLLQRRTRQLAQTAKNAFENSTVVRVTVNSLDAASPYRKLAEAMLDAFHKHTLVSTQIRLSAWLSQAARASVLSLTNAAKTENSVIHLLAMSAVLVGFFGSLLSMFFALTSTDARLVVSHSIGTALFPLLLGIAVSAPLFLGLFVLDIGNKKNMLSLNAFAIDMIKLFLATAQRVNYESLTILTNQVSAHQPKEQDRIEAKP